MNINNKHIYDYVAYPRSGSHFFHQVLSMYMGHSHLLLYKPEHDRDTQKQIKGCFYVWRDPLKVLYSLFAAEFCNENRKIDFNLLTTDWLDFEINRIKTHFDFYSKNAGLVVRYEDLINNLVWEETLKYFNLDYDEAKILDCASKITVKASIEWSPSRKFAITKRKWMNNFMLTDEYKKGREIFLKKYGYKY